MIPAAAIVTDRNGHSRPALVLVKDFYALPDLRSLESEDHSAGGPQGGACRVCPGAAVGVPAAGVGLSEVPGGAGQDGRGAAGVEGKP